MLPTIEACWDWAQKREDMNAPFDFFVYEDAHEKARELIYSLEEYFLDNTHYKNIFYNAYLHYCIVTDYRVEYEKVWVTRPMTPLDSIDSVEMSELVPVSTVNAAGISSQPSNSIPMTDAAHSIPMTGMANAADKPSGSIAWTTMSDATTGKAMADLTPAQRWVINTMYKKYNIAANAVIYNSVSDGSSSTSAQMFKSLNEGDFLMQDLLRTPYGTYVYQTLEQLRPMAVLL